MEGSDAAVAVCPCVNTYAWGESALVDEPSEGYLTVVASEQAGANDYPCGHSQRLGQLVSPVAMLMSSWLGAGGPFSSWGNAESLQALCWPCGLR